MELDKTEILLLLFLIKKRISEVNLDEFEYQALLGLEQTVEEWSNKR